MPQVGGRQGEQRQVEETEVELKPAGGGCSWAVPMVAGERQSPSATEEQFLFF
jgi:hypothetical protein